MCLGHSQIATLLFLKEVLSKSKRPSQKHSSGMAQRSGLFTIREHSQIWDGV